MGMGKTEIPYGSMGIPTGMGIRSAVGWEGVGMGMKSLKLVGFWYRTKNMSPHITRRDVVQATEEQVTGFRS